MSKMRQFNLGLAAAVLTVVLAGCWNGNGDEGGDGAANGGGTTDTGTAPIVESSPAPSEAGEPGGGQDGVEEEEDALDEPYSVIAAGLQIPWSIAMDGDTFYISEREGSIVRIEGGVQTKQAVKLDKPVHHAGEGGFLGLLLAPDFAESRLAYAYYTYQEQRQPLNRIVLLKQEADGWAEQRPLLEGIPGALYHNGGRLAFGPDGMLYATTGDAQETSMSQDRNSLAGKILRMTPDGEVPDDNPTAGSYVYSYGHRNPQGIAWTADGVMYSTEHGPSGRPGGHDEINRIDPGANYGWPDIIGDAEKSGMLAPLYHTGDRAIAPSGTIVDGEGRLIIATLVGEAIYRYTPATGDMEKLHVAEGRIRDVLLIGDRLYFITNNRDGRGHPSGDDDRLVSIALDGK